jgi:hypothetical protein
MTISFDYDGTADFDNGNVVSGGKWNMAVYSDGVYVGSIYGEVSNGFVSWSVSQGRSAKSFTVGGTRTTTAYLTIDGGTGEFEGVTARYDAHIRVDTDLSTGVTDTVVKDFVF